MAYMPKKLSQIKPVQKRSIKKMNASLQRKQILPEK